MHDENEKVGPRAPGVLEEPVDDELIVFSPATEDFYTLNRSAREVWELADGTLTAGGITETLATRYEEAPEAIAASVAAIIAEFREAGLI